MDSTASRSTHTCYEDVLGKIQEHEIHHCVKFVRRSGSRKRDSFSQPLASIVNPSKKRLCLSSDGRPYLSIGTETLYCQHGPSKYDRCIQKRKRVKYADTNRSTSKVLTRTRKLGCPATIKICGYVQFLEYRVNPEESARWQKQLQSSAYKLIKDRLKVNDETLKTKNMFEVTISSLSEHESHSVGENNSGYQPLEPAIKELVKELIVDQFITSTREIQQHIQTFVSKSYSNPAPPLTNQRFYPTDNTVRNLVTRLKRQNLCADNLSGDSDDDFISNTSMVVERTVTVKNENSSDSENEFNSYLADICASVDNIKAWADQTGSINQLEQVRDGLRHIEQSLGIA